MTPSRFSIDQYHRMIEAGILTPDDKVELLENYVVLKIPENPAHAGTIQFLTPLLAGVTPPGWSVSIRLPVTLADSEPEPDFTIVRGDGRAYMTRHPGPGDVGLLVEVANTSLLRDRHDKARIYARAGIAVCWIVNLEDRQVEVHTKPSGPTPMPAYGSVAIHAAGGSVPLVLDGATVGTIPVNDLLP